MDSVTLDLLRENIRYELRGLIATEIDAPGLRAAIDVLTQEIALLKARIDVLESPQESEIAEAAEAVVDGSETVDENTDDAVLQMATEAMDEINEIESDIEAAESAEDTADNIAPDRSHFLARSLFSNGD